MPVFTLWTQAAEKIGKGQFVLGEEKGNEMSWEKRKTNDKNNNKKYVYMTAVKYPYSSENVKLIFIYVLSFSFVDIMTSRIVIYLF